MRYNSYFHMQDFFCNDELAGILPQFNKDDIVGGEMPDDKIYEKCRGVINGFLNGTITDKGIVVENMPSAAVLGIVRACKAVLEAMFNNSTALLKNIAENRRVYTTISSLSQIAALDTPQKKLRFVNEILDNMNYNPEFQSQNSIPSRSTRPYKERQSAWMRRVGYKLKEA